MRAHFGTPKILHLIANFNVGGAELHLLDLIRGLTEACDYDLSVAYLRETPDDARSLVPDFRPIGVHLFDLQMRRRVDVSVYYRLHKLLKETRPHILHTHLPRADVYGIPIARLLEISGVIASVHNTEIEFKGRAAQALFRPVYRMCDRVIAISEAVRRTMIETMKVPPSKVRCIHYGVETSRTMTRSRTAVRSQFGWTDDHWVIGTVGRLVEQKGHIHLLEAFQHVRSRVANARLLIVGHDGGLKTSLQAKAQALGIDDAVVFTGYRDDVHDIMSAIEVFCFPSLYEGLGLVLLEAMRAGCPIVASRVDAIPEIVASGSGILVPPADSRALGDALCRLGTTPDLMEKMKDASLKRVQEFTIGRMIEKTVRVYNELIRNGKKQKKDE